MTRTARTIFLALLLFAHLAGRAVWAVETAPGPLQIVNQASGTFYPIPQEQPDVIPLNVQSNTVVATVETSEPPELPLTLDYFDPTYSRIITHTPLGALLYLEANAPDCNSNPNEIETREVVITSRLTSDREAYFLTETAADSGVFRNFGIDIPTRDAFFNLVAPGNGILEILHDTLTASIQGCSPAATIETTVILIDPSGIVFDSRSNLPVAGATVSLIDVTGQGNGQPEVAGVPCSPGSPGAPAKVLSADGRSLATNALVTGSDGVYEFPTVCPSTYRLEITPPAGSTFPSAVLPGDLPEGRRIDSQGSYGEDFDVSLETGAVFFDVPLDSSVAGFFLKKSASDDIVEVADTLRYTLTLTNQSEETLRDVTVADFLPYGFAYIDGSATLDRSPAADPDGGQGRRLTFHLPDLEAGAEHVISYRTRVNPGALQGNGVNTAQAFAADNLSSNTAQARVEVQPGVFTDRGYVIGKVFVDCDRDRRQGPQEVGIPGVRLFLEDGTWIVTDSEGKFSFYGLQPKTHVLKLDPTTLPAGSELLTLDNRFAGDAGSRFIDLKNGELHRADFAEGSCNDQVMAEVLARRQQGEIFAAETSQILKRELTTTEPAPVNAGDRPATGVIGGSEVPSFTSLAATAPAPAGSDRSRQPLLVPMITLEELLEGADAQLGFLDLADGDTLPFAQVTVRVKGPLVGSLALDLNEQPVSAARIGKRIEDNGRQLQALEFIGIALQPGPNTLTLTYSDQFGNQRQRQSITLIAPSRLGKIRISLPAGDPVADGRTPAVVRVALTDDKDIPVTVRTQLTLDCTVGRWDVEDLNPEEPGVQVFIEGGRADYRLLPPPEPASGVIRVDSSLIVGEQAIDFLPDLRPLIAAGTLEGVINLRRLGQGDLKGATADDGFEKELDNLADGDLAAGVRGAFYLKGKIPGNALLTVAYDSDKETSERLFRDIQPDLFYPVYGDSSVRGFDAQSTERLYVRIDRHRSYLLWGDFSTRSPDENRRLTQYDRVLNGFKGHYEDARLRINTFASEDGTRQVVEEIPGAGVSGPYYLTAQDRLENSERVEIIVRDRNYPARILDVTPKTRFADYEIDALSGRLLFKAPIPTYDPDLNPVFIRVTSEVEESGGDFWVVGADAQYRPTRRLEVGGVAILDDNPLDRFSLLGLNATVQLGDETYLFAEWGTTDTDLEGRGSAERVELRHSGARLTAELYAQRSEVDFANPSSLLPNGRQEIGGQGKYRLTTDLRLTAEGLITRDLDTDGERHGLLAGVEYRLPGNVLAEVGLRYARETEEPATASAAGATPNHYTGARARLSTQIPFLPAAGVEVEYEQGLNHTDRRSLAVGGDYRLIGGSRFYARHYFIDSISGEFAINGEQERQTTLFGFESPYMQGGNLFSEYRLRDGISGRESEAAVGLRNSFVLRQGLTLNTTLERINTLTGLEDDSSTAVTAGIEYTASERWKGSLRGETRNGAASDSYLATAGLAVKANRSLTLLARGVFSLLDGDAGESRRQQRLQLGGAWRPVDNNRFDALWRYEYKAEQDDALDSADAERRNVHIVSVHGNYKAARDLTLSGRYALKVADERIDDDEDRTSAQLAALRCLYDLSERWDAGLQASALAGEGLDSVLYGLGAEVGYLVAANLWVSAGYNFFGYQDRDLSEEDYTDPGAYLRLRFKFDETLFAGSSPRHNKTLPPEAAL